MSPVDDPPPAVAEDRRFAEAAVRLAGRAAVMLGWSPDAFWRATPAELAVVAAALAGTDVGAAPPDAGTIARLREAFPDG